MLGVPAFRPHGVGVRGADLSRGSLLFQGRFGRMFRALPPADYGTNDAASMHALAGLGNAMVSEKDHADPKDGPDDEESGIPAAYTYFGQFIDHDLTFDPASFFAKTERSRRTRRLSHTRLRSGQRLWPRARRSALPL